MYGQVNENAQCQDKQRAYAAQADACDSVSAPSAQSGGMHAQLNGHVTLTLSAEDAKVLLQHAKKYGSVVAALSDYPTQEFHVLRRIVRALENC